MANKDVFLAKIEELKENGHSEKDIAEFFGYSVEEFRKHKTQRMRDNLTCYVSTAKKLSEEGKEVEEIAKIMDVPESMVRLLYRLILAELE